MSDLLQQQIIIEDDRTGTRVETLKRAMLDNLFYIAGRFVANATPLDYYTALAYTVRDRLLLDGSKPWRRIWSAMRGWFVICPPNS